MRAGRRRQFPMLVLATAVAALLAIAPVVVAATTVKTGTYSGKTKQKAKIGFELANATDCAGSAKAKLCLYQLDAQSANINLPCPGGSDDSVSELINPVVVPASHVLRKSFGQADEAGRLSYYLKISRDGKITGWMEESLSTGGGPTCKSGKVAVTTKRTGKAKR